MVLVSGVAALALGRAVWAGALGAVLVLAYWLLEVLAWRVAQGRPGAAIGVALGGLAARFALIVGVFVLVGLVARDEFGTAAGAFLVTFTAYEVFRLIGRHPSETPARPVEAP
jgi:hypothetical protein